MGPSFLLISRRGVDAVLADLEERSARILGLEGFELAGEKIHPRIDLIFDADRLPGFPSPRDFIAMWPDNVWIDVTATLPTADRLFGWMSRVVERLTIRTV
jgi:hypothetical protein